MRKAQIIGQVFVLILAGIIFVLILGYGYKAIQGISQRGNEVAFIDFTSTLKSEVKSISLSYGSVKKVELAGLPMRYKKICIVTGNKDPQVDVKGKPQFNEMSELAGLPENASLIYEVYETGGDNVFFEPSAPKNILLPDIQASSDPEKQSDQRWFCEPVDQGTVVLRLEGLGNAVRVSPWQ
jgi:hypothetical protein